MNKITESLEILAMRNGVFGRRLISLFGNEIRGRDCYEVKPIELCMLSNNDLYKASSPFLSLEESSAQKLMDSLWSCGLRPSEGTGSAGAMAAVEKHLLDMQKIAFHILKIKK